MKEIPLTRGFFALVDDEDFDELSKCKWGVRFGGCTRYATGSKYKSMHRFLMREKLLNAPDRMQVDHINGNGLDNRKCNLRIVPPRGNSQNLHTPKTSKYPGVSWSKSNKKWQATFYCNGRQNHLGYYKTEDEAFAEYKKLSKIVDGIFINRP